MKEELIDFNYEKAKANPELVRFADGDTPMEIVFLNCGKIITVLYGAVYEHSNKGSNNRYASKDLKLAKPKKPEMYVNLYNQNGIITNSIIEDSLEKCKLLISHSFYKNTHNYIGTYKLVKVEENEQ